MDQKHNFCSNTANDNIIYKPSVKGPQKLGISVLNVNGVSEDDLS